MTAHTAFLDYVLPQVPGATQEMALLEIKSTIIDFCEKSLILQTDLDPITTLINISEYDLEPPKDRLVVKIMKMWFKGVNLTPRSFSVYPIPNVKDVSSITLRVALKPTRSATTIDDLIYEEYAETIGHGAITRLALSPNKPYSNAQLAAARNALYTAGLNVARQRAQDGYVRASKQVHIRRI
jgi:hypothetical protein